MGRQILLMGALVTAALLALSGCAKAGNASASSPRATHLVSKSPEKQKDQYQAAPTAEQLAQYDIPADATPQQVAQTYVAMESAILGGQLKESTYDEFLILTSGLKGGQPTAQGPISADEASKKIAKDWVDPFYDAHYVPGYSTDPKTSPNYTFDVTNVATAIKNYTGSGSVQESYSLDSSTQIQVVQSTATILELRIPQISHYSDKQDPSDQNIATLNGAKGIEDVTFQRSSDGTKLLIASENSIESH